MSKPSVSNEQDKDEDDDHEGDAHDDVHCVNSVPPEISKDAIAAAINFVQLYCAFMAGRG